MSQANAVLEITEAVAARQNKDVSNLPPLQNSIDCSGLKDLVHSDGFVKTVFDYAGERVVILSNGDGFDVSLS